jgi:hypothetical protein
VDLPDSPQRHFDNLAAAGQNPRVETMHDGCYVISFDARHYVGRPRLYCAPGGSWTHNADRARQLAERFPLGT